MSPAPRHTVRTGTVAAVALTITLTLGLTACGSNSSANNSNSPGASSATITLHNALEDASYPVNPQRVVVTSSALDNVLALGIQPTAVIMTQMDENAPWHEGKLDGVERITVGTYGDIDVEKIAGADPDIIIGDIYWIDSKDEYDKLSAIAPTLNGPSREHSKATWKERLTQLGELFDTRDEAQQILDDDTALFAQARKEMPGLTGKTGWVGRNFEGGKIGISADPHEASNTFLSDLGMTLPATVLGKSPNGPSGAFEVGEEAYDQLAADFAALYSVEGIDTLMSKPTFATLPQVKNETLFTADYATIIGLAQPSSLVRTWALEHLRPTLERVATSAS